MQPTALSSQKKGQMGTATLGQVELDGKELVIDYCQRMGTRPTLKCSLWVCEESTLDLDPHVFTLVRTISFKDSAMNSFILDKTCRVCWSSLISAARRKEGRLYGIGAAAVSRVWAEEERRCRKRKHKTFLSELAYNHWMDLGHTPKFLLFLIP